MTSSAYVRSVADLGKVSAPANSANTGTVPFPGGQTVLRIEFTAPSPLGLLALWDPATADRPRPAPLNSES
jgi:hypothetical protein